MIKKRVFSCRLLYLLPPLFFNEIIAFPKGIMNGFRAWKSAAVKDLLFLKQSGYSQIPFQGFSIKTHGNSSADILSPTLGSPVRIRDKFVPVEWDDCGGFFALEICRMNRSSNGSIRKSVETKMQKRAELLISELISYNPSDFFRRVLWIGSAGFLKCCF